MRNLRQLVTDFGWPRIIIFLFLVLLFVGAPFVRVRIDASISDVLNRFGQNGLFVLAMVPMIQSGCGLNFGLSIGIIAGLLGATLSVQFGLHGFPGLLRGHRPGHPLRRAVRLDVRQAAEQGQGRGDDHRHVRGLRRGDVHVHHVAAAALHQPQHDLGLRRQGPAHHHHGGGLLAAHPQRLPGHPHRAVLRHPHRAAAVRGPVRLPACGSSCAPGPARP